jgi:hypothetical protein
VLTPTQARARLAHYARFNPGDQSGLNQRKLDLERANAVARIRRTVESGVLTPELRRELAQFILAGDLDDAAL